MLSKKIEKALNEQLEMEAQASSQYMAMAAWCGSQKMEGGYSFFMKHSAEERLHLEKIVEYMNQVGAQIVIPAIAQPVQKFKTIRELVESSLKNEQKVTRSIHQINELCLQEKDYGTQNFLQFFIAEQLEEEVLFQSVLDKITLIGTEGMGLYYIDKELAALAAASGAAE